MRSLRGERGSASVLIIGLSVVVLVGVGFAVDGTRKGQVYSEATSIAEEAARAGGQALRSHAPASGASGDAGRYREIFDFNRGRTQPDGHLLSDPDLIRPGDVLRIPHPALRASGGGGAPASAAFHRAQVQDSCQIPSPPPTPPVPPSPPAKPSPDVRVPVSTSNPSTQVNPSSETDDSATVAAGVGGLLAAGLLTLLAVRRRRARQRRRPGHRIRDKQPGQFEATLHSAAQPGTVDDLDRALRTLARHAGSDLPNLRAVKVGAGGIMLLPAGEDKPVEPFVKAGSAEWKLGSVGDPRRRRRATAVSGSGVLGPHRRPRPAPHRPPTGRCGQPRRRPRRCRGRSPRDGLGSGSGTVGRAGTDHAGRHRKRVGRAPP
jgi:hypothetical protein